MVRSHENTADDARISGEQGEGRYVQTAPFPPCCAGYKEDRIPHISLSPGEEGHVIDTTSSPSDDKDEVSCCRHTQHISLVPRPCFIKVMGGKTGPGRHCQGRRVHALVCPRIPGVTVISFWKPFHILV